MDTILWIIFMLGFSMVGTGLWIAHNFLNNEENKKNMFEMALKWKAKMEENVIQQHEEKVQENQLKKVA